jgi:hypothetical protein
MYNPEFFLGAYKTPDSGDTWRPAALYTDDPPADIEGATQTVIMERRPLLLTPVPGEQEWATAAWAGKPVEPSTPRELNPFCVLGPFGGGEGKDAA